MDSKTVVILGIIGFGAYYIYKEHQKNIEEELAEIKKNKVPKYMPQMKPIELADMEIEGSNTKEEIKEEIVQPVKRDEVIKGRELESIRVPVKKGKLNPIKKKGNRQQTINPEQIRVMNKSDLGLGVVIPKQKIDTGVRIIETY